jgi:hypothetical protein
MNNFWSFAWIGVCVVGFAMAMWEGASVLFHAIGLCGLIPIGVLVFLWPAIMGSNHKDGLLITRVDRDQFRRDVAGEYTPAELKDLQAKENANYVANMAAFAHRTEGYDAAGNIVWQDVVTDQQGNPHVVASGSYASSWDVVDEPEKPEIVHGEVEEDEPWRYNLNQLHRGKGGKS